MNINQNINLSLSLDSSRLRFFNVNFIDKDVLDTVTILTDITVNQQQRLLKRLELPKTLELDEQITTLNICTKQSSQRLIQYSFSTAINPSEQATLQDLCVYQLEKKFYNAEIIFDELTDDASLLDICSLQINRTLSRFDLFSSYTIYDYHFSLLDLCVNQTNRIVSKSGFLSANAGLNEPFNVLDICKSQASIKLGTTEIEGRDDKDFRLIHVLKGQNNTQYGNTELITVERGVPLEPPVPPSDDCNWDGVRSTPQSSYARYLDLNDHEVDISEEIILDLESSSSNQSDLAVIIEFKEYIETNSGAFRMQ